MLTFLSLKSLSIVEYFFLNKNENNNIINVVSFIITTFNTHNINIAIKFIERYVDLISKIKLHVYFYNLECLHSDT